MQISPARVKVARVKVARVNVEKARINVEKATRDLTSRRLLLVLLVLIISPPYLLSCLPSAYSNAGTDVRLVVNAMSTVGKAMTLRDHAQGCWRMRDLGQVLNCTTTMSCFANMLLT